LELQFQARGRWRLDPPIVGIAKAQELPAELRSSKLEVAQEGIVM